MFCATENRNQSCAQESKNTLMQLEDKNAEFEQLALVLHRTRGDLTRKLEKQQKEYEDKISFLIQQLRGAEMKIHESSSLLRKSFEGNDRLESSQHRNAGSQYLRPRTAHVAGGSQSTRRFSDTLGDNMGQTVDQGGGKKSDAQTREEIADAIRKWESEKQRRELLEKRNSELMRELRMYRESVRK